MPLIFNVIFAIFRRILPQKLKERIVATSNTVNVISMEVFSSACLPTAFGGEVDEQNVIHCISAITAKASEIEANFSYLKSFLAQNSGVTEEDDSKISLSELGSEIRRFYDAL